MEYTQGKWEVMSHGSNMPVYVGVETDQGDKLLCNVYSLEDGVHNKERLKESKANARLITAAPYLLEALQGDEENCVPNAQTILSQALLGNYEAVKSMLSELCSIHAAAIDKTK